MNKEDREEIEGRVLVKNGVMLVSREKSCFLKEFNIVRY